VAWIIAFVAVLGPAACGGAAATTPEVTPTPEAPAPPPEDAHEIASTLVAAQLTVNVNFERARGHALAAKIAGMDPWGPLFRAAGIDPKRDLTRAFIAAANARDSTRAIAVVEHTMTQEDTRRAIDTLVARSRPKGQWIEDAAVPTALVNIRGRSSAVALPIDGLVIVLPPNMSLEGDRFAASGGLPEFEGPEVIVARAEDPSRTLKLRRAPRIPKSLQTALATVTLTKKGGAHVRFVADSTNEKQAKKDARALTRSVDNATSVKVSIIRVRAFEPIRFRAKGQQVVAERRLSKRRIEQLLSLAKTFLGG